MNFSIYFLSSVSWIRESPVTLMEVLVQFVQQFKEESDI